MQPKTALVVEDDDSVRDAVTFLLQDEGLQVESATDGIEGLKILQEFSPDLIISDIRMPHMDGIEFLKKVRAEKVDALFILMTGFSDIMEINTAHSLGADDFLLKPFRSEDLEAALDLAARNRSSSTQGYQDLEYCKIGIGEFTSGSKVPTDVFIRLSEKKYIRVSRAGDELPPDRLGAYVKKGLNYFYVKTSDFARYADLNLKIATAALKSPLNKEKKAKVLAHTSEVLLAECFVNGLELKKFETSKTVVENMINIVTDDKDVSNLLDSLKNGGASLFSHSVGVSLFSSLIAQEIGWTSTATQFRTSMGGLFHDIGKKDIDPEILEKSRIERSHKEREIYESHVELGREILSEISWIPSQILQICYHHHEDTLGLGYPQRLNKNRIHPLAKIIAVANEFCNLTLANQSHETLEVTAAIEKIAESARTKFELSAVAGLMGVFDYQVPNDLIKDIQKLRTAA